MIHVLPVRDISFVQQDSATQAAADSADLDVKFQATSGKADVIPRVVRNLWISVDPNGYGRMAMA